MRSLLFLFLSLPQLALAHPGHSPLPADAPAHYLLTPEHAGGALVALAAVTTIVILRRLRSPD